MKMTGVLHVVSGKTSSSVQGAGSVNSEPSFSPTYWLHANISFSSRKIRITQSFENDVESFSSHPAGRGSRCGSGDAAQASHSAESEVTLAARPARDGMVLSAYSSAFHAPSLTQPGRVVAPLDPSPMTPRTMKLHSGSEISPLEEWRRIEVHTCRWDRGRDQYCDRDM